MTPRRLLLSVFFIASCATVDASHVRVTNNPESVRQCQAIGSVTDDKMEDLQRKAARLGGDVALVTLQSYASRGTALYHGAGFRSRTYTTAEVYRCP